MVAACGSFMAPKVPLSHDLFLDLGTADRFDVREVTIDDGLSALFEIDLVALTSSNRGDQL